MTNDTLNTETRNAHGRHDERKEPYETEHLQT